MTATIVCMGCLVTILAFAFGKKHYCNQYENQTLATLVKHVVAVKISGHRHCTGSILSSSLVLTAANCIYNKMGPIAPENITVAAEYEEKENRSKIIHIFHVSTLTIHQPSESTNKKEGIALLYLKEDIPEDGEYMERIPLSHVHLAEKEKCVAFYWHKDNVSSHLDFVRLFVIPSSICKQIRAYNTRYLCLGNPFDMIELSNHHNAGGPLICNGKQHGIAIFLRSHDITSYYANIIFYHDVTKSCALHFEINMFYYFPFCLLVISSK